MILHDKQSSLKMNCWFMVATALLVAFLIIKPIDCSDDDSLAILPLNDSIFNQDPFTNDYEHSKCQPLNIPFCENVNYNLTMMPNFLNQLTQQDAYREINMFDGLLKVGCSQYLKLFLCTVYAPICYENITDNKPVILYPCRSLCESVKAGCLPSMKNFHIDWPKSMQCEKFLDKQRDKNVMCVGKDEDNLPSSSYDIYEKPSSSSITRDLGFVCPKNFEVNSYTLHLNGKTYNNCAMPCEDVLLDKSNTQVVRLTTGILAVVCLISTVFTCITFLVDTKRFKYPARPIIIIAFCQLVVAACYFIGFLTSNKISCNDPAEPPKSLPNMMMIRTITMGNKKGGCTLLFMTLYFFQISTMFWWLMMTISWYMIAKLKWAPEAVSNVSRYFHLFSWTIPAFLTIYLSVLGNIEGDPLTGTCYVNSSNQESIRAFVIYPILICLIAGCLFLISGFKSICESRETLRREYGKQTVEHDKLVTRILMFSILFIAFSVILLCCNYYEQSNLNSWTLTWLSVICQNRNYSIPCPRNFSNHTPHYSTFILKYVATMAMGIVSALFMLSEKTLTAYREVAELCNYRI